MYCKSVVILFFSVVLVLCDATPTDKTPNDRRTLRANGVMGIAEAIAHGAKAIISSGVQILKHIVGVDPPQKKIDVYPYLWRGDADA